jgi:hypothetical protein
LSSLKTYCIEVLLKNVGPKAAAAIVSSGVALAAAHQGLLTAWGVTVSNWPFVWNPGQTPSGPCMLIEFDTLSKTALITLSGLAVTIVALIQHHGSATIQGTPQSGDVRIEPPQPVIGGARTGDPPMEVKK